MADKFYQFQLDTPYGKKFSVIVKALECNARTDAYTIAFGEFGRITRIVGEAKQLKRLPKDAVAVKSASVRGEQWAWIVAR